MKKTKRVMLLAFVMMISMMSCNNEDLFIEPVVEEVVDEEQTEVDEEDVEEAPLEVDASLPCDFDLNSVEPNSTVIINCVLDLGGNTISLPEGVTFEYEGGDIVNGTLNFSDNTTISGELLNASLTLGGSKPAMKDPVFHFDPERWGIIEGIVSDDVADNNRKILKLILSQVSELGVETFMIDELDAYFKVDSPPKGVTPSRFAIIIPSNFTLMMTDNTHLRIQPNAYKQPSLLSILDANNVIIDGGILHGERDEHDYSDGSTHEWETLISIKAGNNIVIKNVTMMDSAGDGIGVSNLGHSYDAIYKPSINILISKNTFIRNRRNQLSIVDGRDVIVDNNTFIDASIHTDKSSGTAPGYAIDVEAVRGKNPAGPQQIAQDIIIRNNIERGSRVGGFTVHTGDRVTIEGNQMENKISYSTTIGTIIRNNTLTAIKGSGANISATAIVAGRSDLYEKNHSNKVYGNTINGFSTGIEVCNTDIEVYNNVVNNCNTGVKLKDLTFAKIFKNTIKSTRKDSDGINSHPGSKFLNEVFVNNNTIDVANGAMGFTNQNNSVNQNNFKFYVNDNNLLSGAPTISNTQGFNFKNNTFDGRVRLVNAVRGLIASNIINSTGDGIRIDDGCKDIIITENTINAGKRCIWFNNNDSINVTESKNICTD